MLFVLTGDIQTGKSRWLELLAAELSRRGVCCSGVIAPGVWQPCAVQPAGAIAVGARPGDPFEKRGIDNVLLPGGERVRFAVRRDLADERSRAAAPAMGWVFDESAISRVNAHFKMLDAQAARADSAAAFPDPGFLIVDELGRLELLRGEGLTNAMMLLDRGPTAQWPHALIVVRDRLLDIALARFASAWPDIVPIAPTDESRDAVLRAAVP